MIWTWLCVIALVIAAVCGAIVVFTDRSFHPMSDDERKIP